MTLKIEHLGSAHGEAELEALKAAAQQRIAAGQLELGLGLDGPGPAGPLPITSSRMSHLVDALKRAYRVLGFDDAAGGDDVFRHLVARIIEPSSKLDSLRVLGEAGVAPASYRTLKRRLPAYAEEAWRQGLSEACAAHARLGPASLVLYDVSMLYFEADQGDQFREPGFSKERRLEPWTPGGRGASIWAGYHIMIAGCGSGSVRLTSEGTTVAVPGQPVPPSAIPRLTAMADRAARVQGDRAPEWVSAVVTTHEKALTSATPGDFMPGSEHAVVYLVTMKGHFAAYNSPRPRGSPLPTGTYSSFVINAETFRGMDSGLSDRPPPVAPASLGPVTWLKR